MANNLTKSAEASTFMDAGQTKPAAPASQGGFAKPSKALTSAERKPTKEGGADKSEPATKKRAKSVDAKKPAAKRSKKAKALPAPSIAVSSLADLPNSIMAESVNDASTVSESLLEEEQNVSSSSCSVLVQLEPPAAMSSSADNFALETAGGEAKDVELEDVGEVRQNVVVGSLTPSDFDVNQMLLSANDMASIEPAAAGVIAVHTSQPAAVVTANSTLGPKAAVINNDDAIEPPAAVVDGPVIQPEVSAPMLMSLSF